MKKYFITGLVILLPLALTLAIVLFLVDLFTGPFIGVVREVFNTYGLFQKGVLFLSATQTQQLASQLLILTLIFFATVLIGLVAKWFFVHTLLKLNDFIFQRIPIVRTIYRTSKDVIQTIFTSKTSSFKQVVMVPFPTQKSHCLGFLTKEDPKSRFPGQDMVSVFVPTAPNPTSGYLILYQKEDLIFIDMRVEDAFKCIVSCGVIMAPFQKLASSPREKERQSQAQAPE